jgi:hypothetical protein
LHRTCQNLGPLFLVEAGMSYEPHRLINTCTSFEWAVTCAEEHHRDRERSGFDDVVRVRAIQPGPGEGVVVARWYPQRTYGSVPTVMGPDGYEEEAEGPVGEDSTRWERVL